MTPLLETFVEYTSVDIQSHFGNNILIRIRNMTPLFTLEPLNERLYTLEWTDEQGVYRRQTYNKFDVDKNFRIGIWTGV